MSSERRGSVRADCELMILITPRPPKAPVRGQAREIGEGGLGVKIGSPIEPRTECRVTIHLPDGSVLSRFPATVVWCQSTPIDGGEMHRAGLAFTALSSDRQAAISPVVQRCVVETLRRLRAGTVGLQRVSRLLEGSTDLPMLLERIMDEAKALTDAEASSLMLWDAQREELFFEVALGERGEAVKPIRLQLGEGVAGSAAKTRRPVNVSDVARDPRWFAEADAVSGFETRSVLALPMLRSSQLVGVLEVLNRRRGEAFTAADEASLSVLAGEAAILIENARLQQEKLQAERLAAIGRAVSELAHCIKNILNGIQGGAYVLDLGLEKDDSQKLKTGWNMVKRNATFLSNLVLDMLAYAKERAPHYEDTDINGLINTVVELLAAEAARRGIEVTAQLDSGLPVVRVDPTGIYRVLLNLGTNAVDACTENSGRVCVRSQQAGDGWLTIEVEDNGCGIAPEHRARLFAEFFSTKGAKGTGLGLPVAGKIVKEHGGRIDVDSAAQGGARFAVWLPVGGEEARTQHRRREEAHAEREEDGTCG